MRVTWEWVADSLAGATGFQAAGTFAPCLGARSAS